jgi:Carboxypeptidase regulatory-like domain
MKLLPSLLLLLLTLTSAGQDPELPLKAPTPDPANSTLRARVFYELTGRPVRRTSVMLMSRSGGGREASGITDANGNLEIKNLKAGKYYAIVNAPGVVSPLAYIDFRKSRADSFDDQLAGFPAIVVNGISDIDVQIPVRSGGAISGRVTHADGDPAIGVKVEILRKVDDDYIASIPNMSILTSMFTGGAGTLQTDDRGQYRFAGLPAGEYLVKVSEQVVHPSNGKRGYNDAFESMLFGSASMVSVFFQDAFEKEKAQSIKVEFGQELSEINILIPDRSLHTLEGRLVAAKDKLTIRNASITIRRQGDTSAENEALPTRTRDISYTDEKGNWKFVELPKGKYKLIVQAENSEFDETEKAYGRSAYASNTAANVANAMANSAYGDYEYDSPTRRQKPSAPKFSKKIQEFIIEDKDLSEQVIELSHGATISGMVTTNDGKGIPNSVTIMVSDESGDVTSSTSVSYYDYEGNSTSRPKTKDFKIEGIASGKTYLTIHGDSEYYVKSAVADGTDLMKGTIELKDGGEVKNVRIVLAKDTGTLKGTIIDSDKQPVSGMSVTLVPTDPTKFRNSSFFRSAKTDENGEFEVKLPPFEYALVSFPGKFDQKKRDDIQNWLAEAVKKAQTFKIEAGQTTKSTIKLGDGKASP